MIFFIRAKNGAALIQGFAPNCAFFVLLKTNIHHEQKYLFYWTADFFSSLLALLSRDKIEQIAGQLRSLYKKLDAYTHLVTLLFAVLKGRDSLREITIGLLGKINKLAHLGIT